jgi:hypothetical protein
MVALKDAIANSPTLIPIDYASPCPIYLAIDSSWRAVGWILSQDCEDGQQHPSCFSSIAWNAHESCYSQLKIELYGLFCTLHVLHIHIIGITNLVVEMDAQYMCGMLNNPDVQPNMAMNCWIAAILLFNFKLEHVPTERHLGPNGLSRHKPIPREEEEDGDPEDWIDEVLSLGIWVDSLQYPQLPTVQVFAAPAGEALNMTSPPQCSPSAHNNELEHILHFLTDPTQHSSLTPTDHK